MTPALGPSGARYSSVRRADLKAELWIGGFESARLTPGPPPGVAATDSEPLLVESAAARSAIFIHPVRRTWTQRRCSLTLENRNPRGTRATSAPAGADRTFSPAAAVTPRS